VSEDDWSRLIARLERESEERRWAHVLGSRQDNPWVEARLRLYEIARTMFPPAEVEDVVQNVLVRLQSRSVLRRLKASRSPRAYVTVMMRNSLIDAVRRAKRRGVEVPRVLEYGVFDPQDEVGELARAARIRDLVAGLNTEDIELLRLRFWEDMSMAEMARRLDVPYSTVAVRMFRLLRRLRDQLDKDDAPGKSDL
jgi:RNA polymerase sigma factor (sigma-70 family)